MASIPCATKTFIESTTVSILITIDILSRFSLFSNIGTTFPSFDDNPSRSNVFGRMSGPSFLAWLTIPWFAPGIFIEFFTLLKKRIPFQFFFDFSLLILSCKPSHDNRSGQILFGALGEFALKCCPKRIYIADQLRASTWWTGRPGQRHKVKDKLRCSMKKLGN